jgi:hypothetical protein
LFVIAFNESALELRPVLKEQVQGRVKGLLNDTLNTLVRLGTCMLPLLPFRLM